MRIEDGKEIHATIVTEHDTPDGLMHDRLHVVFEIIAPCVADCSQAGVGYTPESENVEECDKLRDLLYRPPSDL